MSTTDTFRAFFAAPLAPPAAAALERAAGPVCSLPAARCPDSPWRVIPARLLHVTLRFLGDVPSGERPALSAALRQAAAGASPFPVAFRGWHLLPGPRDPRVLAVGVSDPSGTLPGLAAALEAAARALGFPPENRPFLSHVTVARRRPARGRRPDGGKDRGGNRRRGADPVHPPASGFLAGPSAGTPAAEAAGTPAQEAAGTPAQEDGREETIAGQEMDRITLVRSTLKPDGPVYEVLEEALLGSSP